MRILPVIFALTLAPLQAQGPEIRTTARDRTNLSVTIYQNGLAAIRDTRRVTLPAGPSRLAFADLVPTLRPKSATLLDPGKGIQVRERNYEFNLLSPMSLVDASLGLPVRIKGEDGKTDEAGTLVSVPLRKRRLARVFLGGDDEIPPPPPPLAPPPSEMTEDEEPENQILSAAEDPSGFDPDDEDPPSRLLNHTIVLQPRDPRVMVTSAFGFRSAKPSQIHWLKLPPGLHPSPTLMQEVVAKNPSDSLLTLLYTAEEFTWSAHYEATLSGDCRVLNLQAFAQVANRSGLDLDGTILQLVAGEPHLIYDPPPEDPEPQDGVPGGVVGGVAGGVVAGPPIFRVEKISEYPLFTLDRPVTLKNQQDKQLALLHAENIPVRTTFLVGTAPQDYWSTRFQAEGPLFQVRPPQSPAPNREWATRRQPTVYRMGTIQNIVSHNLGRALPKGSVTIRYQDPSGNQLVLPGSGNHASDFPQTPPGEDIELMLGPARGIRVDRLGTFQKTIATKPIKDKKGNLHPQRRWTYGVRVRIANELNEIADLAVREPLRANWKLKSATHPGHRSGNQAWDFQVKVQPHQVATLTYTVLTSPEGLTPQDNPTESDDSEDEPAEPK